MMDIHMLGIDIAKNIFQIHGADHSGKSIFKKRVTRDQLSNTVAKLPLCLTEFKLA